MSPEVVKLVLTNKHIFGMTREELRYYSKKAAEELKKGDRIFVNPDDVLNHPRFFRVENVDTPVSGVVRITIPALVGKGTMDIDFDEGAGVPYNNERWR